MCDSERGGAVLAAVDAFIDDAHIGACWKLAAFNAIAFRIPTVTGVGERHVSYVCFNRHRIGLRSKRVLFERINYRFGARAAKPSFGCGAD